MGIRVGPYFFGANALVLPFAAAFFVLISLQNLRRVTKDKSVEAWGILMMSSLCGALGAWIHARAFPAGHTEGMRFGLLGGHYGALIGAELAAVLMRRPVLASADAVVPAFLVGSAIARIGCLFAGCCLGVSALTIGTCEPFHYWPAFDLVALLFTAAIASRAGRRLGVINGTQLATYLCIYGALRFGIEFARDIPPTFGPFTSGQVAAALQAASGAALLQWTRQRQISL